MQTINEKFTLKDIIKVYDSDPMAAKAGNQGLKSFTLNDLKFICEYLKNKIHRSDLTKWKIIPRNDS